MNIPMTEHRIRQILNQRIAMGAGEQIMDDYDIEDVGRTAGGVMLGGARRRRAPRRRAGAGAYCPYGSGIVVGGARRRRRPSAWNLAVGDYVRKHPGMTVAEAAHALSRRRGYSTRRRGAGINVGGARRRRAPVRRRRARRSYGYGEGFMPSAMMGGASFLPAHLLYSKEELARQKAALRKYGKKTFCSPAVYNRRLLKASSPAAIEHMARICGYDPVRQGEKRVRDYLRSIAKGAIPESLLEEKIYPEFAYPK